MDTEKFMKAMNCATGAFMRLNNCMVEGIHVNTFEEYGEHGLVFHMVGYNQYTKQEIKNDILVDRNTGKTYSINNSNKNDINKCD